VTARQTIAVLLASPFLGLGWLAGFTVKAAKFIRAALIEGYEHGSRL